MKSIFNTLFRFVKSLAYGWIFFAFLIPFFVFLNSCKNTRSQVTTFPDRVIRPASLPTPDGDYMREVERIQIDQFGVKVTNLTGHRIGCSPAMPPASSGYCWNPVSGFRETLKGTLRKYEVETRHMDDNYTGSNGKEYRQGEYDWNLYIEPASSHREKFNVGRVTGEVTPAENFYDNIWFPLKGTSRPSKLLNNEICVYGPYVMDKGNHNGLEIHPIDAIWWQGSGPSANEVIVMLLHDAAKGRFREAGMFNKESCDDNFSDWKPWIQYPQLEEIKIPFSYDPSEGKFTHMVISVHDTWDITTDLQAEWRDSDDGSQHQLLVGGNTNQDLNVNLPVMVRVTEGVGRANQQIAVQFISLTKDAHGITRGYIQLLVAMGDKTNKHEGVMVFTLAFSKEQNLGLETSGPMQ